MKTNRIILTLILSLAITSLATAQVRPRRTAQTNTDPIRARVLPELTDEQKAKIEAIKAEYLPQIQTAETPQAKRALSQEMKQKIAAIINPDGQPDTTDRPNLDRLQIIKRLAQAHWQQLEQLNLTTDQIEKLEEIKLYYRDKMAAAETREEIQNLFERMKTEAIGVLTPEQIQKLKELRGLAHQDRPDIARLHRLLSQLDLTDEQKEKIHNIHQRVRNALANAETPEAKQDLMTKAFNAILALLTEEQKARLEELKADQDKPDTQTPPDRREALRQLLDKLALSDDQKTQIGKIHQEARTAAADAQTPEEKQAIKEMVYEKILAILTEEQKQKLETMKARIENQIKDRIRQGIQDNSAGLDILQLLKRLDLTETQQQQIQNLQQRVKAALANADTPEAKRQLLQRARTAILDLLTEEQKTKLDELKSNIQNRIKNRIRG